MGALSTYGLVSYMMIAMYLTLSKLLGTWGIARLPLSEFGLLTLETLISLGIVLLPLDRYYKRMQKLGWRNYHAMRPGLRAPLTTEGFALLSVLSAFALSFQGQTLGDELLVASLMVIAVSLSMASLVRLPLS